MAAVPPGLATVLQDRYRLDRELGQGGMATVYLAHDLRNNRPVALKVLRPELAAILGAERFLKEIETTANLQHPHILPLFDSGEAGTFLFYVMPFVEGESLRSRLNRERQLPVPDAVRIAAEVASALDYAHRQGIIHRDIKPENILLHDGHALVADFGIALALRNAGGDRLTETGLSLGTPHYMSPEQAMAERQLDVRTDVYSLGAVLYEMLAGEPPITGATGQAVIAKLMTERPTPLRVVRDTVPPALEEVVARALAKVPADRFPTAAAFAKALQDSPQSGTSRPVPPQSSRRLVLLAAAILVVLSAVGWQLLIRARGRPGRDPELVALYQRALHSYGRRTSAGVTEAIEDYSAVVRRDSTYSDAWAGLAKAYVRAYDRYFTVRGVTRDSVLRLAVAAADRALTSDRGNPESWLAQAMVGRSVDPTDIGPALRSVRQSLALDSTVAEAWHILAVCLAETGNFDGAMQTWRRAVRVDSSYAQGLAFLALGHYWRRQYDSAVVWADSAVATDPNVILARSTAGYVAIERGDFARAAAAFDAVGRLSGDVEAANALAGKALAEARAGQRREATALVQRAESLATAYTPTPLHTAVYIAQAHAALGQADRALAWLTRYEPRRDLHFQLHLRCDPPFAPLHGDPRFRSLLILPLPPNGVGC